MRPAARYIVSNATRSVAYLHRAVTYLHRAVNHPRRAVTLGSTLPLSGGGA